MRPVPNLLQHRDNPVHWRPWGPDALAEARQEGKPILLSIGYAACHWCHVMAHESFENQEIADLMNGLFVNIKVDREERPDVDTIYQAALAMMGEHGGWPLTMFLTPEGEPFFGGTYFPPAPRFGRPAFPDVLQRVAEAYKTQPDAVQKNVQSLRGGLAKLSQPEAGKGFPADVLEQTAAAALRLIDPLHGGTVGAPKFPQPVFFRFLWRAYLCSGSTLFRDAVLITLSRLCQGGIYDHLGGGFARYSVDSVWLVPHFEKMLYDNALLVDLLTEAWTETRDPRFAERTGETVAWALTDLRTAAEVDAADFAFASAFDADSEGVEGKYYVWTEAEIDALLGDDAPTFKAAYDVTLDGNWEGATILNRTSDRDSADPDREHRLAACRTTLLAARAGRVPPQRDDKVLADWNGLMIVALARAAAALDQPSWLEAATQCFAFVRNRMQQDGRLLHTWCAGRARHAAVGDRVGGGRRPALLGSRPRRIFHVGRRHA